MTSPRTSSATAQVARPENISPPPEPSPTLADHRRRREWETMKVMIHVYCHGRHGTGPSLCGECRELLDYAAQRLERCRFGAEKPTCAKCPVHCYQRQWRERVRAVMRYAGPRMVWRHPLLSVRHWLDS